MPPQWQVQTLGAEPVPLCHVCHVPSNAPRFSWLVAVSTKFALWECYQFLDRPVLYESGQLYLTTKYLWTIVAFLHIEAYWTSRRGTYAYTCTCLHNPGNAELTLFSAWVCWNCWHCGHIWRHPCILPCLLAAGRSSMDPVWLIILKQFHHTLIH